MLLVCSMYRMLMQFHERYKHLKIRYIIAENGIADETDVIRRPYMIEHLLAIKAAIQDVSPIVRESCNLVSNWQLRS